MVLGILTMNIIYQCVQVSKISRSRIYFGIIYIEFYYVLSTNYEVADIWHNVQSCMDSSNSMAKGNITTLEIVQLFLLSTVLKNKIRRTEVCACFIQNVS